MDNRSSLTVEVDGKKGLEIHAEWKGMEREWPGALLARRTRTLGRCSFDARSRRRTTSALREMIRCVVRIRIRCWANYQQNCN
jgi:hypothetical protein